MIVIVGAGLAGLAAAHRLLHTSKLDPSKVLILEAKQRVGGRIESQNIESNSRIDLGAQWLHGERSNPIYNWLLSNNLIEGPEVEETEFEGLFSTPSGEIPPAKVVSRVLDILLEAKNYLYKVASSLDKHAKPAEIYRKQVERESKICPILKDADKNLIKNVERWFELYEMIDNSCEDISLLSLKAYSDWTDFDDGKMTLIKGGWQGVVDMLVTEIGSNIIQLNSKVERISLSERGVKVDFTQDGDRKCSIDCDHAIITCSVGFLKKAGPDFFVPPIEESRMRKINRFGFGSINKIFLQFSRPFLVEERGLKLLWPDRSASNLDVPEWATFITGFDLVANAPNCLMGWIGGPGASLIESVSDQEVGQTCLRILKMFLPFKDVPELLWTRKSNWARDSHILGSYSYPSTDLVDEDIDTLWDPIYSPISAHESESKRQVSRPIILFAGEATVENMYATAHGAILSGWREADRLAKVVGFGMKLE